MHLLEKACLLINIHLNLPVMVGQPYNSDPPARRGVWSDVWCQKD